MFDTIPSELKLLPQWVVVMSDSKLPLNPYDGTFASTSDCNTWGDYTTAEDLIKTKQVNNLGFVFTDSDYIGIDIDCGYNDGLISALAADIIGKCHSYTEKSRSGRGFHIILKGEIPFKGRNNRNGVEMYKSARYFIMTGNTLLFNKIEYNQQAVDYIIVKYFPEMKESNNKSFAPKIYSPVWKFPENNRIKLRPTYPRIPNGSRNICLTSLAGMLHNQGYSKQQIFNEISYANTSACDPPLDSYELQTITNSVTRYKR